jgi:hypothetical protein
MRTVRPFRLVLAASCTLLLACSAEPDAPADHETADVVEQGASTPDWYVQRTLHVGERRHEWLRADARRQVFPFYVGASPSKPVSLAFTVQSYGQPFKLAVLSPIGGNGKRTTVASAGYGAPSLDPSVDVQLTKSGNYVVVVQHQDAARTFEDGGDELTLNSICYGSETQCKATGALYDLKPGAIVSKGALSVKLNPKLGNRLVRLWFSPNEEGWDPVLLGSKQTKAGVATFVLPEPWPAHGAADAPWDQLAEGDNLFIEVPGYDDGTRVRLWSSPQAGANLRHLRTSDFDNLFEIAGVAAPFEGSSWISLYSETRQQFLASSIVNVSLPGHPEMGLLEYRAQLLVGDVGDPNTPTKHELLSITENNGGKGTDVRRVCFDYCQDLSGLDPDCATVEVACPPGEIETVVDSSCGPSVCAANEYCCNESCGICSPLDGTCTQQQCDIQP